MVSQWRSIRPLEINQYDITMATNYDITWVMTLIGMRIVKSQWVYNDVARDFHCVAMCRYLIELDKLEGDPDTLFRRELRNIL